MPSRCPKPRAPWWETSWLERSASGCPDELLAEAWPFVDFTRNPLVAALDVIADDATALGLAPRSSHATLLG